MVVCSPSYCIIGVTRALEKFLLRSKKLFRAEGDLRITLFSVWLLSEASSLLFFVEICSSGAGFLSAFLVLASVWSWSESSRWDWLGDFLGFGVEISDLDCCLWLGSGCPPVDEVESKNGAKTRDSFNDCHGDLHDDWLGFVCFTRSVLSRTEDPSLCSTFLS